MTALSYQAAAFGRLCVETLIEYSQLPIHCAAAFGRLCVETCRESCLRFRRRQPPSGGCVLKLRPVVCLNSCACAAAFGRLCVETLKSVILSIPVAAAAFGRLCVETSYLGAVCGNPPAAAFGRLCVETRRPCHQSNTQQQAAAFGRLCVETRRLPSSRLSRHCSRLRAAVC